MAAVPSSRKPRCIVIGAGLAGLSAGYHLCLRGWDVEVLEADKRIGGRVFSFSFPEARELVCELGGEWIGNDHTEMLRLAREVFKLEPVDHRYSFCFWNGATTTRWYTAEESGLEAGRGTPWGPEVAEQWKRFQTVYRGWQEPGWKTFDQTDFWAALEMRDFPREAMLRCDSMFATDFGESIRHVGAYSVGSEYFDARMKSSTDEMDWKIRGGNDKLVLALRDAIHDHGGQVRPNMEVISVHQAGGKVTVGIAGQKDQGIAPAQACICAIPAWRLREIDWQPALDPAKVTAANQLGYARIMKTAVLYDHRFWDQCGPHQDGFSVVTNRDTDFCFDSTDDQPGPRGILCSYAIGDKADDLAGEPDENLVGEWITRDVADAVAAIPEATLAKGDRPTPVRVQRQAWQDEQWIGGAYALFRPGQWFTLRNPLRKAHRRVHFAGEHLADAQGFMEGAIRTGQHAAQAVDQAIGRTRAGTMLKRLRPRQATK